MNLSLTEAAARHLHSELGSRILRIAFTTGCGGSGYRLASADVPQEGDVVLSIDGVRVALDDLSAKHLDGAVIGYSEDEDGYVLDHPDAVAAVWCG